MATACWSGVYGSFMTCAPSAPAGPAPGSGSRAGCRSRPSRARARRAWTLTSTSSRARPAPSAPDRRRRRIRRPRAGRGRRDAPRPPSPLPREADRHLRLAAAATSASVTSTIASRSATAMCSSALWTFAMPLARFTQGSPRSLKTFASAPPPTSTSRGSKPARSSPARARTSAGSSGAAGSRGTCPRRWPRPRNRRPRRRTRTSRASPAQLGELPLVAGTSFESEPAARRHDVQRATTLDQARVGGRLVVDAPQAKVGDRPRGRDDRRAAVLRVDPGMGRPAREDDVDRAAGRRRDDDLADGARVVVDEADPGLEP